MTIPSETVESEAVDDIGKCQACSRGCKFCRDFLITTSEFSSFHTQQKFKHKDIVDCDSECVVYLINVPRCKKSYVGYTTTPMKIRWANTKSHINKYRKTCELCTHMIECNEHNLVRSSIREFDTSLKGEVEVIIIEKVCIPPGSKSGERERLCQIREGIWQTRLRTLTRYGGLNILDERRRAQEKLFCRKTD